jgi:hypothetical protein
MEFQSFTVGFYLLLICNNGIRLQIDNISVICKMVYNMGKVVRNI